MLSDKITITVLKFLEQANNAFIKHPYLVSNWHKVIFILHFILAFIYIHGILFNATTPIQVQEGGDSLEHSHIIFNLCFGRCSLPLHLQMVGQR